MIVTYRTLDRWDGDYTTARNRNPQFSAGFDRTLAILGKEIDLLVSWGRSHTPVSILVDTTDIRKDGAGLLQGARFGSPACAVVFRDDKGRELRFQSDRYDRIWGSRQPWRDNLHAIALTLEQLRALNRWGVVSGGQQYRGFAALGSGIEMGPAKLTRPEAAKYLAEATGHPAVEIETIAAVAERAYRDAAQKYHPDRGGDAAVFARVTEAIQTLRGGAS